MSEMKFDKLSLAQQQKIIKLISIDFRKAKALYSTYLKQPSETENNN
jgi:hypothetical protein